MANPAELFDRLASAFNQQQWPAARQFAMLLLPLAPKHPLIHYIAGIAAMEQADMPEALERLHAATLLAPDRPDFATQYAKALSAVRSMSDARQVAEHAMQLGPRDAATLDTLGVVLTQTHAHELAAEAFRRATHQAPRHAPYRFNLATALIANGDMDGAEAALESSIEIDPCYWKSHLTLAQLRKQSSSSNHIGRLASLLAAHSGNVTALTYLNMALAKEYEDVGQYPEAFAHLTQGKHADREQRNYSIHSDQEIFAALKQVAPRGDAEAGHPTDEPIFIVGMPRTGTTLLERILSSHPDVYSAGELQNFALAYKYVVNSPTDQLFDLQTVKLWSRADWNAMGEAYLSSTRPITGKTKHFIDKLPHNFLYAGFIAQALPNAKIICLRRDPIDTCLSNFRQLFSASAPYYGYSFDLLDTGRYYTLFDDLMRHWHNAFPGRILDVHYETLVDSQEATTRQLLSFCGLTWNDACLDFQENPAPVNTASAVQVRSPVYRSSLRRWKKYEPQLGELIDLLRHEGIRIE